MAIRERPKSLDEPEVKLIKASDPNDDHKWMLVEFEGTYQAAHPDGIKGKVLKPFRVKVEMDKGFLEASYSLRAPFHVYHVHELKRQFPDLIDTHRFSMVEATNLDGSRINDPRALSHENLIDYISEHDLPINQSFYDVDELRHQVVLYKEDPKGQQYMQGNIEKLRGGKLDVAKRISARGAKIHFLPPTLKGSENLHIESAQRRAKEDIIPDTEKVAIPKSQTAQAVHDQLDDLFNSRLEKKANAVTK